MYFITGSNLFGQWIGCGKRIIDKFINFSEEDEIPCELDVHDSILEYIGWSHNILKCNNKFYITGDYLNSGRHLEEINLPKDCTDTSNLLIVSNDYRLLVVDKSQCQCWILNLENKEVKYLNLTIEVPIESKIKRPKKEHRNGILKCANTNETLMLLTSSHLVYEGLLPTLIDTSSCDGLPFDIKCGNEHNMLLTTTGKVYTWGNGMRLQLGHGDVNTLDTPALVEALAGIKIVKISAGGWHSIALSEYGDLYVWGWNDTGQLGVKENSEDHSLKSYPLPTLVDIYDENGMTINIDIKDIAAGSKHSAILLCDGSIWTSGINKYGQLGHSVQEYPSVPYFKKCCSFEHASEVRCGPWSTVVNVLK